MRARRLSTIAVGVILLAGMGGTAHGALWYQEYPISGLGDTSLEMAAISPDGTVVGDGYLADGNLHGVEWTASAGLDDATPGAGPVGATLDSINVSDVAAGYEGLRAADSTVAYHAVTVQPGGAAVLLPTPTPDDGSFALAINDPGQVVGEAVTATAGPEHAVIWQPDGTLTDLGSLKTGGGESRGQYIDDAGEAAGVSDTNILNAQEGQTVFHAFFWSPTGGMVDVNTAAGASATADTDVDGFDQSGQVLFDTGNTYRLWTPGVTGSKRITAPPGTTFGAAVALGGNGMVAGEYTRVVGTTSYSMPFAWTAAGGGVVIPLPSGYFGYPTAVAPDGTVVGVYTDDVTSYLFTWSATSGFRSLGALGTGIGPVHASINAAGDVAVYGPSPSSGGQVSEAFFARDDSTPPTVASANSGMTYTAGDAVQAQYTCSDEDGGSGVASCVGTVANGDPIDTSSAGARSYDVTATDNAGNTQTVSIGYTVVDPLDHVSATMPKGGGTITTDTGAPGPTPGDPTATTLTDVKSGAVAITEGVAADPPAGFDLVGQPVQITAPHHAQAAPMEITISFDRSLLPAGADPSTVQLFGNGVLAKPCSGAGAIPNPCLESATATPPGDVFAYVSFTIRATASATWVAGLHQPFAFSGFGAPVKSGDLNRVAAGGGVKLVFSLGGNDGKQILATGSPAVTAEACPGLPVHVINNPTNATASTLAYSAAKERYTYTWATPSTPGCYALSMRLIDGTTHTVDFQLV